ncbi:sigma-70 family RNA polymerase sigma factor [Parapedobacter koreensis]|uniref:RNA polymerase sigma-70 factor, ECF subfamily n=1 Tax=Parapedobacter koreensis TaxID=332977 RepID=A0A1H7F4F4_9SPHI|nr:sigma-70 family RNA polymerase sigma factor [Parapedobacter koreensis]SEK18025.1 RNA polymerase sigma-70 factor, ECF subfamily [Parapedobacter koreensis]
MERLPSRSKKVSHLKLDEKTFVQAYEDHWKALYLTCLRDTEDAELAKELVQELFRDLWERREALTIRTTLKDYLHGGLRLKIFEYYRKQAVRIKYLEQHLLADLPHERSAEHYVEGKELVHHIQQSIGDLTPRCREVYRLSREDGLSNKAIAGMLGISEKAVESNITRALAFLRARLSIFR